MITNTATSLTTEVWQHIVDEATQAAAAEPVLAEYLHNNILNHGDMAAALSFHLASKLSSDTTPASMLRKIMTDILCRPEIIEAAANDIQATVDRDSACGNYSSPFLYYKGFLALQSYRVSPTVVAGRSLYGPADSISQLPEVCRGYSPSGGYRLRGYD